VRELPTHDKAEPPVGRTAVWLLCAGTAFTAILAIVVIFLLIRGPQRVAGDTIIANCAIAAGGSVTARTISVACGPSVDQIEGLIGQISSNAEIINLLKDYRNNRTANAALISKIATTLRMTPADISAVVSALSSEIVIPQNALSQFAGVTREYIDIAVQVQVAALSSSDPAARRVIDQAAAATRDGQLFQARRLLAYIDRTDSMTAREPTQGGQSRDDDLTGYGATTIAGRFHLDQCSQPSFNVCRVELNKIYAFHDLPPIKPAWANFSFVVPPGVRRVRVHYQYLLDRPIPTGYACFTTFYWESYYPNGSIYGGSYQEVELVGCKESLELAVGEDDGYFQLRRGDQPPRIYLISIRQTGNVRYPHADFPTDVQNVVDRYGNNFAFAITD